MKKITSLLLTVVMFATMLTVFAVPASAETEHKWKCGTGEDYLYHICETCNEKEAHTLDSEGKCTCGYDSEFLIINNAHEYREFTDRIMKREDFSGKTVLLMTDITVNNGTQNFNGILDGCGHTINVSNLSPFVSLDGATVKNLTVSGNANSAGFAMRCVNTAFINCTNLCTVNANKSSSFVDNAENCSFINCINRGDIGYAASDASGFSTLIKGKTKFVNCASIGKIEGYAACGIGYTDIGANITLSNIYIGGSINGSNKKYLLTDDKNTFAENIYASTDLEGVPVNENVTPTYTSDIGDVLTMMNTEAAKHEDWNSWVLDENGKLMIAPYKYHPAVEPTDTEAGSLPYYEANGKYYSDSDLTQEITDINAWLGVGGAGYVEPTETATESAEGSTLSEGNIWIIAIIAVVVIAGIATLVIVKKKKKPALAGGENTDEE